MNPAVQLAFYDPGLGSQKDSGLKISFLRQIYNFFSSGMGVEYKEHRRRLLSTSRIVGAGRSNFSIWFQPWFLRDCALRRRPRYLWRAGAHGGWIRPQARSGDGTAHRRRGSERIQYGSSIKGDPFKELRMERARAFRKKYGSGTAQVNRTMSEDCPLFHRSLGHSGSDRNAIPHTGYHCACWVRAKRWSFSADCLAIVVRRASILADDRFPHPSQPHGVAGLVPRNAHHIPTPEQETVLGGVADDIL